jgi:ribonuclease P protein component
MLPPHLRFSVRQTPQFFEQALSYNEHHIRLLYLRNDVFTESGLKLAIVVPKRHGGAVARVKTKRLLRSAINELSKELTAVFALPYSVVIFVKGRPQEHEQYKQELEKLLMLLSQNVGK